VEIFGKLKRAYCVIFTGFIKLPQKRFPIKSLSVFVFEGGLWLTNLYCIHIVCNMKTLCAAYLSPVIAQELTKIAKAEGISRSHLIERLVEQFVFSKRETVPHYVAIPEEHEQWSKALDDYIAEGGARIVRNSKALNKYLANDSKA
jgi:Ribbon-helix-helix protein, copG family.